MSDVEDEDEEERSSEMDQTPEEEDDEEAAVRTISVSKEEEKLFPADYIILCRGVRGQVIRYKTHKQALARGSIFFRDMFSACKAKETDVSGGNSDLEELEMDEDAAVLLILLRSMYSEGRTIQEKMEQEYWVSEEDYSR